MKVRQLYLALDRAERAQFSLREAIAANKVDPDDESACLDSAAVCYISVPYAFRILETLKTLKKYVESIEIPGTEDDETERSSCE